MEWAFYIYLRITCFAIDLKRLSITTKNNEINQVTVVAGSLCNKDAVVGQQKPEAAADTVFEMLLDDALKCLFFTVGLHEPVWLRV